MAKCTSCGWGNMKWLLILFDRKNLYKSIPLFFSASLITSIICIFIFCIVHHCKRLIRRQHNLQADILAHYIDDDDELEIYRYGNRLGFGEIDSTSESL